MVWNTFYNIILWLATTTAAAAGARKVQCGLTPLWLAQPQHLDVGVDPYAHSTVREYGSVCGRERERCVCVWEREKRKVNKWVMVIHVGIHQTGYYMQWPMALPQNLMSTHLMSWGVKKMNCLFKLSREWSNISFMLIRRFIISYTLKSIVQITTPSKYHLIKGFQLNLQNNWLTEVAIYNSFTMKTSNSSRHLKGASMVSQRAMMKQTVVKDLSPPDRALVFFVPLALSVCLSTWTCISSFPFSG